MSDGASTPRQELADDDRLWVVDIIAPLPPGRVRLVAADAAARLNLPAEKLVSLLENRIGPVTKPLPHRSAHRVAEVLDTAGAEVEMRSARSTDGPPSAARAAAGARDAAGGAVPRGEAAFPSAVPAAARSSGSPRTSSVVPARRKTDPRPHDPWRAIADDAEGRDVDDAMLGDWRRADSDDGRSTAPRERGSPPVRAFERPAVASRGDGRDPAAAAFPTAAPDASDDAAPDGTDGTVDDSPLLDRGVPVTDRGRDGVPPAGGDVRERPDPVAAGGDPVGRDEAWDRSLEVPGGVGGGADVAPAGTDDIAPDGAPPSTTEPATQDVPSAPARSAATAPAADAAVPSAPASGASVGASVGTSRRQDDSPPRGTATPPRPDRVEVFDDPRVAPVRVRPSPSGADETAQDDVPPQRFTARPRTTAAEGRPATEEDEDHGFGFGMRDPFAEQERRDRVVRRAVLAGALVLAVVAFMVLQWAYSRSGVAGATPPPYAKGLSAYRDGAFVSAARAWLPGAEAGDAQAMYMLGYMAEIGQGRPWSNAEAAGWYRQAAERGHAPAQLRLAALYRRGMGVTHDDAAALTWTLAAAEAGLPRAQLEAARLLAIEGRHEEAFSWLRVAAESEPEAAAWLGVAGAVSDLNPRSE